MKDELLKLQIENIFLKKQELYLEKETKITFKLRNFLRILICLKQSIYTEKVDEKQNLLYRNLFWDIIFMNKNYKKVLIFCWEIDTDMM